MLQKRQHESVLDGGLWVPTGTLLTHPQLVELDDDRIDEETRLHTGFTAALHGAAECLGASDLPSMPVMGLNGRKEKLPPHVAYQTCLPMPMPVRPRKHIRAKTDSCVADVCVFPISLYFFPGDGAAFTRSLLSWDMLLRRSRSCCGSLFQRRLTRCFARRSGEIL